MTRNKAQMVMEAGSGIATRFETKIPDDPSVNSARKASWAQIIKCTRPPIYVTAAVISRERQAANGSVVAYIDLDNSTCSCNQSRSTARVFCPNPRTVRVDDTLANDAGTKCHLPGSVKPTHRVFR